MFSSVSQALHWAFLLSNGAQLEVRGRRAHIAVGAETRTLDVGDMTATDLRVLCAGALRDARAALSRLHWGALCARFGRGQIRAEGFTVLLEWCGPAPQCDLSADAAALFADTPSTSPGARLLSSLRSAWVMHALASLPTGFLADHVEA